MSNIDDKLDKQTLRETAVLAGRLKIDRLKICGSTVLALLDELEAAERRIAELDKRLIEYAGIATREARRVAELEKYRTAFMEWHDKTAWVQSDKRFDVVRPLGKHRADVLREYIELLEARAAQTLTVRVPVRCDCCYSESEAAMFDGVVADFREKLELACVIAGIKLQIEGE